MKSIPLEIDVTDLKVGGVKSSTCVQPKFPIATETKWKLVTALLAACSLGLAVALAVTVTSTPEPVGVVVKGVTGSFDLRSSADRRALLEALKENAGEAAPANEQPAEETGEFDAYRISGTDVRLYVSGSHRRPTDPATPEEIDAALGLLYGPSGKISSLDEADELAANPLGWKAVNDELPPEFRIYPEMIHQVNRGRLRRPTATVATVHNVAPHLRGRASGLPLA